jgi:shikimate O-hydroxycinnamoyltransferase
MLVTVVSSELVVPSEATPRAPLWLSNLDLAARNAHTALVYFYRPNDSTGKDFFSTESLKSSLAKALVPFYPLAGRLGADQQGRTEIHCNGEGALFIVARSNAKLDDFDTFAPSAEMKNLFVPPTGQPNQPGPLLMVQVYENYK